MESQNIPTKKLLLFRLIMRGYLATQYHAQHLEAIKLSLRPCPSTVMIICCCRPVSGSGITCELWRDGRRWYFCIRDNGGSRAWCLRGGRVGVRSDLRADQCRVHELRRQVKETRRGYQPRPRHPTMNAGHPLASVFVSTAVLTIIAPELCVYLQLPRLSSQPIYMDHLRHRTFPQIFSRHRRSAI